MGAAARAGRQRQNPDPLIFRPGHLGHRFGIRPNLRKRCNRWQRCFPSFCAFLPMNSALRAAHRSANPLASLAGEDAILPIPGSQQVTDQVCRCSFYLVSHANVCGTGTSVCLPASARIQISFALCLPRYIPEQARITFNSFVFTLVPFMWTRLRHPSRIRCLMPL